MRILAIRGKNLASLANEFEVLLEEGVLKQVGLFAITGPTGAGKSTILDALCLALYDQMPRLPEGHGVSIGHKDEDESIRVKSHDVSSILRRGTAAAYAEVDFIGQDKHSYRARWEISRARAKVDGRLQAQKVSLQNLLTKEYIGQGKKDTQQEIVIRIGLNFDQFRRSVLLAQGDFAAFLKAKKDERSSLLEKITGTDIYSELSIAAFERAKQEKQKLDRILEKMADKVPLDIAARAELEQEKLGLTSQLAIIQQSLVDRQKIIAWYIQLAVLKNAQKITQEKVQQSQNIWDSNVADRELLKQVEQAQPLRNLLLHEQSLVNECLDADLKLQENQTALNGAVEQVSTISKQLDEYHKAYNLARQQHSEAQPLLIAARKLDTQIDDSNSRLQGLAKETATQQAEWQTARTNFEKLSRKKGQLENSLQQIAIWQEQYSHILPLANQWGRWETEIQEYITLDKDLQQHAQLEAALVDNISQQQSKLQTLQAQQEQALTEKNNLSVQLKQAEQQANELSLSDLHQQKALLENQKENLDAALGIAVKTLEIQANQLQAQNELHQAENTIQLANAQKAHIQLAQVNKQFQLQEAQQAFDLMQAASQKSAEDLRGLLKDQQPCPVCGADEHPWADLMQPIKQPLSDQQARLNTLQAEKEQLIQDLSEQLGIIKQAEKNQQLSTERIGQAKVTLSHLHEQWLLIVLDNKTELTEIQQAYVIALSNQSNALKTEYAKLKQQEEEALQQQQALKKMRSRFEQFNQLYIDRSVATAALDKKLAELCSKLSATNESVQRVKNELNNLMQILSVPLKQIDHWQAELAQAGDAFLQQIRTAVSLWQEKAEQQTQLKEQYLQLEKELLGAESEQTLQSKLYLQYQQELDRHTQQKQVLLAERRKYFSGKSANDYAANLDRALQQREANKQESAAQLVTANTDVETSKAAIGHWQKEQQRRVDNHVIAQQKLATALQVQQISKQTLESLLGKDELWIKTQTEKNQALAIALQEAQTALKISTQNILAHQGDAPEEQEEHVREQIEQFIGQQDKLTQDKENNAFALRSDDEKIATGKALQGQLQTQQQNWEKWESLNELIGSSSGQKFRVFAQSLTLETLLSYTNRHLQEFARRYLLQRVPGSDLELQVIDLDMADEVRSVHSLSGGESFLVSLALALGLASLSSNKTQVESLFIDEGFGSLDQETLDIAIASLDTLQSLGRKVGVISHVAVLVERIGAQIVVQKLGGGQSSVTTRAG